MKAKGIFSDRRRSLAARAIVNHKLEVEWSDEGRVVLTVPKGFIRRRGWHRYVFLLPRDQERRVELDTLGSFVWGLCEEKASVRQIILAVAERYRLSRREAEVSVIGYIKNLGTRGFIGLEVDREDA